MSKIISQVEQVFLDRSNQKLIYAPEEKLGVVVVESFPELGKLVAFRFIEWVLDNPEGTVSLPTGKTPEHFIIWIKRILEGWSQRDIREELGRAGINTRQKPDLRGLRFIQIDEFYPINPGHHNSFYYYVNEYYIRNFGLDPERALLINCEEIGLPEGMPLDAVWSNNEVDLSLRYRSGSNERENLQKEVIENIDQWCVEYENRIRALGGIGFFLGGIGPDGHIGFNVRGSDLNSTTRLSYINYETQAAASTDLGGIEIARKRLVITIGLATITCNPDCVAIIMAAGEAKKRVVAKAVRAPVHVRYPASSLRTLPEARFYLTAGAARDLTARQCAVISSRGSISEEETERIVVDLALQKGKAITQLTAGDFKDSPPGRLILSESGVKTEELTERVDTALKKRIEAGSRTMQNKVFLHTEPHHDDIMLGYLPFVVRHIRDWSNSHFFVTLTSGFTAVTNSYMLDKIRKLKNFLQAEAFRALAGEGYFNQGNEVARNRDVWQYLDGVASHSAALREEGEMRRLTRDLMRIYAINDSDASFLADRIDKLINYFETRYPGQKDSADIQKMKGMCREWESDCLWGFFGWNGNSVDHLRLGFYKGDIFTEEPTVKRDVIPILNTLRRIKPDVVTVALDPEASGPDTHYKVMQAISEALRLYEEESGRHDLEVLGYRNVWYRFHPSEANLFVPVSLMMFSLQHSAFMHTFRSQKNASFPSYEHDGPFSELAQGIQVDQYRILKTCLGRSFFNEHSSALIRATRGIVFLRRLSLQDFFKRSRELKASTES